MLWLVGPAVNKALTRAVIRRNIGLPWRADNGKGVRELGLTYRPLEETLVEFFRQMVDASVFDRVGATRAAVEGGCARKR